MMGIKGQIPALCGEFWIFPIETILLAEFFNPFCCLSCCHIQTGIFADVNPWLWIMQVIWINLVYNNLEEQRKNIMILLAIFGQIRSLCWITSKQFLRKISQKLGSMIQSCIKYPFEISAKLLAAEVIIWRQAWNIGSQKKYCVVGRQLGAYIWGQILHKLTRNCA